MIELQRPPQNRQPGFTLVELIVVMMVIGIMAVVVLPRFDLLKGYDEVGFRDKVRSTLEYARKSAVAQRRNVQVSLDGNNLTLMIDNEVPEAVGIGAGTYPRDLNLPAPDRACGGTTNKVCAPAGVTLAGPTITFTPLGAPSAAATYTVTGEAPALATYAITVEAETGHVH